MSDMTRREGRVDFEARPIGNATRSPSSSNRPWLLGGRFFADHADNRLRREGDVKKSRNDFITARFNNLDYLLKLRYSWMNAWLKANDCIVEIGAGAGLSKLYISQKVFLSDVIHNSWIDISTDARSMAFGDESIDVLIVSNSIHHLSNPVAFFTEVMRVLKPAGLILINDTFCSLLLRFFLRVAKHEGYSYDINIFDDTVVANDPRDPWSGNNAIPNLLFDRPAAFHKRFPGLQIVMDTPCECLIFPASGGVTSKLPVPELPTFLLDCIARFDELLTKWAPRVFALCRRTVVQKVAA